MTPLADEAIPRDDGLLGRSRHRLLEQPHRQRHRSDGEGEGRLARGVSEQPELCGPLQQPGADHADQVEALGPDRVGREDAGDYGHAILVAHRVSGGEMRGR